MPDTTIWSEPRPCPNCEHFDRLRKQRGWAKTYGDTGTVATCRFCKEASGGPRQAEHRCFGMIASETDDPPARFKELCERHDLTFAFSDDSRYWATGEATLKILRAYAAAHLTPAQAAEIWNAVVDGK